MPTNQVAIAVTSVNGGTPPADGELRPGDVVTFSLSYDLTTGDYEDFALRAYLPLPLFDLSGISWSQGGGAGQWNYGAGNNNTDPAAVDAVSTVPGNAILFNFGNYATPALAGTRIEVEFTLTVGNLPFADQRSLTLLGQSTQLTTIPIQQQLLSQGAAVIKSIAEPTLAIRHGVVAVAAGGIGTVTGTTGSWAAAGTAGPSFSGSITELAAVDGAVTGIDGGDLVRLATALENTGGLGAFDVTTTVTLPADFVFLNGSLALANLQVRRGDGTLLVAGTDYSVSGNEITFLDPGTPNQPSLLPGRPGTPNDLSGANIVVITYDVVAAAGVAAARTLQSGAALTNYASTNGGPDFTPVDRTDTADQQVASPLVAKGYAGGALTDDDSSAPHTLGSNLVVGEAMLFDIVVTLPEGSTQSLRITDLVPAGFRVDTTFNGNAGYLLLTTVAQSGALAADFAGSVSAGTLSAPGGDGADLTLALASASANADNDTTNNAFVVRVRLVAGNVFGNLAGRVLANSAEAVFTDPDGDTPNGSVAARPHPRVDRQRADGGHRRADPDHHPDGGHQRLAPARPGRRRRHGDLHDHHQQRQRRERLQRLRPQLPRQPAHATRRSRHRLGDLRRRRDRQRRARLHPDRAHAGDRRQCRHRCPDRRHDHDPGQRRGQRQRRQRRQFHQYCRGALDQPRRHQQRGTARRAHGGRRAA